MRQSVPSGAWLKAVFSKRLIANTVLVLGAIGAGVWLLSGSRVGETHGEPASAGPESVGTEESDSQATRVKLSPKKLSTAAIETERACIRPLAHTRTVPGRIEYDASRRLQLRVPAECVVKEVLVRPGQWVTEGTKLAVLTSKQIGLARDEVRQYEEDLRLARYQHQWTERIVANVKELLAALAQSPEMSELEAAYEDRPLGEHRHELLAAYSDLLLAKRVQQESAALGDKGVLSGRTLQQRLGKLERARAAFDSMCEETHHHVGVEKQTAEMAVARAERALKISTEQFAAMLGPYGTTSEASAGSLNEFVVAAPFAGRIEDRHIMAASVITANSPLFTLADTDHLWVAAQIHEGNWQAASIAPGQKVRVRTPATGPHDFTATIEFVGAVVDPETRALPLVARIANTDRLLRPGMFAWVSVPVEAERDVLTVPASAVMRHEGQAFVFVADADDSFRRVDITTGLETEEWIEIRDGLIGGEMVAASGAFALKSELLLEREEG